MENADQLDSEEWHRACGQLMFLSEIKKEFWQLKLENEKLKNQNKKCMEKIKKLEIQLKEIEQEKKSWGLENSQLGSKIKLLQKRHITNINHFLRNFLSWKPKLEN